ncbi:hypothetical protein MBLNU457_5777t1 [Dothideomycetes sp. NU457]
MPQFRDDQILIIAPGSQTTLAQLGLPESLTPARFHFRSCMFPGEEKGEYEPNKIRPKDRSGTNGANSEGQPQSQSEAQGEIEYEEDFVSEEGAVWPLKGGQIVDWPCFYALITYVYNTINPPFHTPILFVAEPVWTQKDHERITQFFFERFKVPAFGLMDSAMATSYAYGLPTATVIDVGQDKADVTAIAEFMKHDLGRVLALADCGGEAMTQKLQELLGAKGFTREMCEQLKRSNICEVLPLDGDAKPKDSEKPANPAVAGNATSESGVIDGTVQGKVADENDGVIDVASIVTGGNMKAYLEQKEQERLDKAAAKKKGGEAATNAPNKVKLPNSKRPKNTFVYEDHALHNALKQKGVSGQEVAAMQAAMNDGASATSDQAANGGSSNTEGPITREIEVGQERFQAASGDILEKLADAIFRTVSAVEDIARRSDLWESLVIVGNGSKVRGFKEALLATLQRRYLISPSSATIFNSELPSQISTPLATGMNTPQPQGYPPQMPGSQVNPLLMAATTAQNPHLNPMQPGMPGQLPQMTHSSHGQTPTSIKMAKIPEYFPEWKDFGYEEASFLGAQVAAKVLFGDNGVNKGYMLRSEYNESGPQAIHDCSI